MNITSRQLKAFLLTARHQSFSRAAERLFITQSGMSVLVRELEDQLGFRLFDRTTRRVTLTEFGTKFLPIADRSLVDLESAAVNIGRSATDADRRLSLGAPPLIAGKLLASAIGEYAKRDPDLHISLHDGERAKLIAMVVSGALDVGIGCFLQPMPGVRRTPIYRFSLMLIEPAARAGGPALPMRWSEIGERPLLALPAEHPVQQVIDRQLERVNRRGAPEMVFNYFDTQIAMVEAGAGSAVLPGFTVPACLERRVALRPLAEPMVPIELYQIVNRGKKLPAAAEAFARFLRTYIAEWAEPWNLK
jgi:LysR family transcriptional regulator, carnitine catabolism transcriptional activator